MAWVSGVTLPFGAPLLNFCRPHKFFTVSKKKKKKGRHFFFGFSYRLLAPWSFLYPQIFFSRRPNAKLAEIWYILLLCQKIFRLKNCKFGNMPPPKVPPPCMAGVAGAVVTPLAWVGKDMFLNVHLSIMYKNRHRHLWKCIYIYFHKKHQKNVFLD